MESTMISQSSRKYNLYDVVCQRCGVVVVRHIQLVEDLERELLDYEKTSGYSFPVKKPAAAQVATV